MKDETALYYALSTIAQCAAALAALIGFFGLQAVERLRHEEEQAERSLRDIVHTIALSSTWDLLTTPAGLMSTVANIIRHPDGEMQRFAQPRLTLMYEDLKTQYIKRGRFTDVLVIFLFGTLAVLVIAIGLIPFAEALYPWVWTMRVCVTVLSLWLGVAPAYVVFQAAGGVHMWQQAWSRVRHWHGPALVAARLRDRWRRQQRKSPP